MSEKKDGSYYCEGCGITLPPGIEYHRCSDFRTWDRHGNEQLREDTPIWSPLYPDKAAHKRYTRGAQFYPRRKSTCAEGGECDCR